MKIVLLAAQSKSEPWQQEALSIYQGKLKHFTSFQIQIVKPKKYARDQKEIKRDADSTAILDHLIESDFVVLCDEKGTLLDSSQLAKKLQNWLQHLGNRRLVVVVGGAYGVNEELRQRANFVWSLSTLTFNHLVIQTMIVEQVYRAFTILKNLPYHNE